MKAYEAIKRLKVDRKEFLEEHGIKSHMSNIPSELEEELFGGEKKIEEAQQPEAPRVDTPKTDCPYPVDGIRRSIRLLGAKSPAWKWRHLVDG